MDVGQRSCWSQEGGETGCGDIGQQVLGGEGSRRLTSVYPSLAWLGTSPYLTSQYSGEGDLHRLHGDRELGTRAQADRVTKVLEFNLLSGRNQGCAGKPLLISPTHTGALMIPRGQWSLPDQVHQPQVQAFPTPAMCSAAGSSPH